MYVYRYINRFRQWTLFQNLSVPGSYEFGYSIVVKGNIAVISAPRTGAMMAQPYHIVSHHINISINIPSVESVPSLIHALIPLISLYAYYHRFYYSH